MAEQNERFSGRDPIRVRLCLAAPLPPPMGGMSVQAERLLARWRMEGQEVAFVRTNPQLPAVLRWVEAVPGLRTVVREIFYIAALLKHVSRCDVVHHLAASGFSFFVLSVPAVLVSKLFGKRLVLNYRGGLAEQFLGRWAEFVVPVLKQADVLVVPSVFLQRVFSRYGIKADLMPNIADVEAFEFKARRSFRPRVLVTRQLEPIYNVASVLRAFAVVQQHCPGAVLGIAGGGSETQKLRSLSEALQLRNVTFFGAVKPADLPALYADHDVFVNASLIDNFPGSLVEAACAGLPIVSTRAGGIPDMIKDNETGILTNLEDDAALAAGILRVLDDAEVGRRLAAAAQAWAQQFRWEHVYPALLRAYGVSQLAAGNDADEFQRAPAPAGSRK